MEYSSVHCAISEAISVIEAKECMMNDVLLVCAKSEASKLDGEELQHPICNTKKEPVQAMCIGNDVHQNMDNLVSISTQLNHNLHTVISSEAPEVSIASKSNKITSHSSNWDKPIDLHPLQHPTLLYEQIKHCCSPENTDMELYVNEDEDENCMQGTDGSPMSNPCGTVITEYHRTSNALCLHSQDQTVPTNNVSPAEIINDCCEVENSEHVHTSSLYTVESVPGTKYGLPLSPTPVAYTTLPEIQPRAEENRVTYEQKHALPSFHWTNSYYGRIADQQVPTAPGAVFDGEVFEKPDNANLPRLWPARLPSYRRGAGMLRIGLSKSQRPKPLHPSFCNLK